MAVMDFSGKVSNFAVLLIKNPQFKPLSGLRIVSDNDMSVLVITPCVFLATTALNKVNEGFYLLNLLR